MFLRIGNLFKKNLHTETFYKIYKQKNKGLKMFTFTCDFKVNNTVIKTVDLDADILLKELNKQQYTQLTQKATDKPLYTKTEQDDIARVKAISMTDWISLQSFTEENGGKFFDKQLEILEFYINNGYASSKQAYLLLKLYSAAEKRGFVPELPF